MIAAKNKQMTICKELLNITTQSLLNKQFMASNGAMSWSSEEDTSLAGASTKLIESGSYEAGRSSSATEASSITLGD